MLHCAQRLLRHKVVGTLHACHFIFVKPLSPDIAKMHVTSVKSMVSCIGFGHEWLKWMFPVYLGGLPRDSRSYCQSGLEERAASSHSLWQNTVV
eukprot:1128110-Amphidinium_carterae.1